MRVPRVHAKERPPRLKAPETAELGSTELYNPWSSFRFSKILDFPNSLIFKNFKFSKFFDFQKFQIFQIL